MSTGDRIAGCIQAASTVGIGKAVDKIWVDDSHRVFFIEERLLVCGSNLQIVDALCVINIRTQARIGEVSILRNCQRLNRTEISKGILAWVVIELIAPHKCSKSEHGVRAEYVGP